MTSCRPRHLAPARHSRPRDCHGHPKLGEQHQGMTLWYGEVLTHRGWDKMTASFQKTFWIWMKMYAFGLKFNWNLFLRVQWTICLIGSDNGLAPSRWQAIIWTNDDYFTDEYMHHALSLNEEHSKGRKISIPVKVILDISGSLVDIQWDSRKYPG